MNIGIIGHGIVGKAHEFVFRDKCTVFINDPIRITHPWYRPKGMLMNSCDIIFISVPTPYDARSGEFDDTIIKAVFKEISEVSVEDHKPVLAIKSAVPPRVIFELEALYPTLRIVVNPEYLSERNSIPDLVGQTVLIVGGEPKDRDVVVDAFLNHSACNRKVEIGLCTAAEAALIKYMENAFLALKVIFMNECKELYDKLFGTTTPEPFNELIRLHQLDPRMGGPYPYCIPGPDGDLGFGGKCLPKDMLTLLSEAERLGVNMETLKATWSQNTHYRTNKDWEEIPGAVQGAYEI